MKFSYDGCTLRVEDGPAFARARLERFDKWRISGIGCSFVIRQFCIAIKDPICFELEYGSDAMQCIRDFQEKIESCYNTGVRIHGTSIVVHSQEELLDVFNKLER